MQCERIADFYQTNYSVKFGNYLRQIWKKGKNWSCLDAPKKEHLFLFFIHGGATYTLKNGETVTVEEGELIYTPKGSEYTVRFDHAYGERVETQAVRFSLFDDAGADIVLPHKVFRFEKNEVFGLLFDDMERLTLSATQIPVKYACVLYALLSELGAMEMKNVFRQNRFQEIQKGLEYLTLHFTDNTSVESLAVMCHISTVYFRRLFKQCTGMSPVQYRTEIRLKRAREYLLYGGDSISEIAEALGYLTPAYFIKQFKEKYHCSPYAYRLKCRGQVWK